VFDVGFWELTLIATLALLVLGPDKLPGVVNSVGRMLGRARSLARGLKVQIEREMNQAATVTPKPKTRSTADTKPKATPPDGGDQSPGKEDEASAAEEQPGHEAEPARDDLHGQSTIAK